MSNPFAKTDLGGMVLDIMRSRLEYAKLIVSNALVPPFVDQILSFMPVRMKMPSMPGASMSDPPPYMLMMGLKPECIYSPRAALTEPRNRKYLRKAEETLEIDLPNEWLSSSFVGKPVARDEIFSGSASITPGDPANIISPPILLKAYIAWEPSIAREVFDWDLPLPDGTTLIRFHEHTPTTVLPQEQVDAMQSEGNSIFFLDTRKHGFFLPFLMVEERYFWGRWRLCQVFEAGIEGFVDYVERPDGGMTVVLPADKETFTEVFHDVGIIRWEAKAHWKPMTILRYCLDCIDPLWESDRAAKWRAVNQLMDFLLFAFGYIGQPDLPLNLKDPQAYSRVLQILNTWRPFLLFPFPYFGQLLYELSDDETSFPEPASIKACEQWLEEQEIFPTRPAHWQHPFLECQPGSREDPRLAYFIDPAPGYGELLMAASSYTYNLHALATDLNPLAAKALLLHGFLYMPWFHFPTHVAYPASPEHDRAEEFTDGGIAASLAKVLHYRGLSTAFVEQTESDTSHYAPISVRRWKKPEEAPVNRYRLTPRLAEILEEPVERQPLELPKDDRFKLRSKTEAPLLATRRVKLRPLAAATDELPQLSSSQAEPIGFGKKLKPAKAKMKRRDDDSRQLPPELK